MSNYLAHKTTGLILEISTTAQEVATLGDKSRAALRAGHVGIAKGHISEALCKANQVVAMLAAQSNILNRDAGMIAIEEGDLESATLVYGE